MIYGYARVSTDGQSLDAQVKQLRAAGAEKVVRETASGAKTDRAQLRRVLGLLEKGDVLTVTRLDRLARSTRDLLNTLATITGKGAGFHSLNDTWADTTTAHGRLMLIDGPPTDGFQADHGGLENGVLAEKNSCQNHGSSMASRSSKRHRYHRDSQSE